MFLRLLHAIAPHLILVVLVQHALGLLAAVLFFLAVRRCGGPRGLGLAPAAIIALGGDELFLEHAALSEALFIFLLSAMLYCAVRASDGGLPVGRSGRPVRRVGGVGPRSGPRDGRRDRHLAHVQRRAPAAADDRRRPRSHWWSRSRASASTSSGATPPRA